MQKFTTLYSLSEDTAINNIAEIIHEIYGHRPTSMKLILTASIDEVATVHVEYDGYVLNRNLNGGEHDE